jgi:hypothetical protein
MSLPTQDEIAYTLWLGGFGDDSARNWYMAGWLLHSEQFTTLVDDAGRRKSESKTPEAAADESWLRSMAELLFDLSYRLYVPSPESATNWSTAEALWKDIG